MLIANEIKGRSFGYPRSIPAIGHQRMSPPLSMSSVGMGNIGRMGAALFAEAMEPVLVQVVAPPRSIKSYGMSYIEDAFTNPLQVLTLPICPHQLSQLPLMESIKFVKWRLYTGNWRRGERLASSGDERAQPLHACRIVRPDTWIQARDDNFALQPPRSLRPRWRTGQGRHLPTGFFLLERCFLHAQPIALHSPGSLRRRLCSKDREYLPQYWLATPFSIHTSINQSSRAHARLLVEYH